MSSFFLDSVVVNDVEYENIDFQKGKISKAAGV